jgi:hypothetical protein
VTIFLRNDFNQGLQTGCKGGLGTIALLVTVLAYLACQSALNISNGAERDIKTFGSTVSEIIFTPLLTLWLSSACSLLLMIWYEKLLLSCLFFSKKTCYVALSLPF